MNTMPFEIERTYDATADLVWKAITDKDLMKKRRYAMGWTHITGVALKDFLEKTAANKHFYF